MVVSGSQITCAAGDVIDFNTAIGSELMSTLQWVRGSSGVSLHVTRVCPFTLTPATFFEVHLHTADQFGGAVVTRGWFVPGPPRRPHFGQTPFSSSRRSQASSWMGRSGKAAAGLCIFCVATACGRLALRVVLHVARSVPARH